MVAKWCQVRSREGRMPIGSFAEPESFIFTRFYKGLAITVRLGFILAGPFAQKCKDFQWFLRKSGAGFFWQVY